MASKTTFGRHATELQRSHGMRRRFKGRMLQPVGQRSKGNAIPRSPGSNGPVRTRYIFECGQREPFQTKTLPGQYKVQLPRNTTRYMGPA